MTNIYLPNGIANKYDVGSKIFKIVGGKKNWYTVISVHFYGFKSKNTHTKFIAKKIKPTVQ